MRRAILAVISLCFLLGGRLSLFALNPSLAISQYAHTAWTVRDGFALGNIYAIAQTPDGYLWLGSEFGLFRFDGVRFTPWHPAGGIPLAIKGINSLLVTRDGTLWIGTFSGLESWNGARLTSYPDLAAQFISSLFEDHEGTVWVGTLDQPGGRLCAIRGGNVNCDMHNSAFGRAIWGLYEDSSGNLWGAAQSGLWRLRPGPPRLYPASTELIGLSRNDDGRLLIAVHGAGLMQFSGDKIESYPVRGPNNSPRPLRDPELDSNRILRDRDGGLWIGAIERGLIHIHNGRTDVFTKSDGLAGDVILAMYEDREGDIWVSSTGGLDRFRELPVSTVSVKQGLSSDATQSVLAATDGSIWIGAHDGLTRFKDGQATILRKGSGLPDSAVGSLFQDDHGKIWGAFPGHGLGYLQAGSIVGVLELPSEGVHSITGDHAGNLWLSTDQNFLHLLNGKLVKRISWSEMRRAPSASVLLYEPEQRGLWMGFWSGGGLLYFIDGHVRATYTVAEGLGQGEIADMRFDRDGALWLATEQGGLSRLKNGRFTTLTTRSGLPCDTIHWSIEDDERSLWLYTSCGLVRTLRTELDAWIADPQRKIATTVWGPGDGVRLRATAASAYSPRVAKTNDGRIWFVTGEGLQVVDPRHLAANTTAPPVHIEQIVADHKLYWQNLPGAAASRVRLPARTRDLQIGYTALSLTAPEKVHFKYKLEGQDNDWREVINDREVQYSNLAPGPYRFRVIASNNSGVWNEQGDALDFSIAPAYYQTNWFRVFCALLLLALVWVLYQMRVRQFRHEFALTLEARVRERTSIARELHDTLLQSFQGLMLRFEIVSQLIPDGLIEVKKELDTAMKQAADAITEGRDAVQGLRASTVQANDLARSISTIGEELVDDTGNLGCPAFRVTVEGESRELHPILRDEIYRIATEALRNAFHHALARQVEVEIRYDNQQFRLRVRDDGKGIDQAILSGHGREGHFGLPGMRERANSIGGKLVVWSEPEAGTEVELRIPADTAYARAAKHSWLSELLSRK